MQNQNVKDFLDELAESLDMEDGELSETTKLEDLAWDSLAVISSIALLDEYFNKTVSASQIAECKTIGDLLKIH